MSGIAVKKHILLPADTANGCDILNAAYLLVGMLDRNQNGFAGNGIPELVQVYEAISVHVQISQSEPLLLQRFSAVKDRKILDF